MCTVAMSAAHTLAAGSKSNAQTHFSPHPGDLELSGSGYLSPSWLCTDDISGIGLGFSAHWVPRCIVNAGDDRSCEASPMN